MNAPRTRQRKAAEPETAEARDATLPANDAEPITRFCIAASAVIEAFKASEAAARCAPTIAAAKAKCAEAVAEAKRQIAEEVAAIKAPFTAEIAEAKVKYADYPGVRDKAIAEARTKCAEAVNPVTAKWDVVTKDAERTCAEAVAAA